MSGVLKASSILDGASATTNLALDSSGNVTVGNNLTVSGTGNSSFGGNVGIGTSSPGQKLDVVNTANSAVAVRLNSTNSGSSTSGAFIIGNDADSAVFYIQQNSSGNTTLGGANSVNLFSKAGAMTFSTASTERMRIDSSGNVGIGTSSITTLGGGRVLQINAASGTAIQSLSVGGTVGGYSYTDGTNMTLGSIPAGYLSFLTTNTERMRIDSVGNVAINTTNTGAAGATCRFTIQDGSVYAPFGINNTAAGTGASNAAIFARNGTIVGTINVTGSATAYNTSSDYRLKENVEPITNGLSTILSLAPVQYNWKIDKSVGEGFIAHELQAIIPNAVFGEKDAVDAEGNPIHQGVDYSKIVVHLVAALQEAVAKIDALETRITQLESK